MEKVGVKSEQAQKPNSYVFNFPQIIDSSTSRAYNKCEKLDDVLAAKTVEDLYKGGKFSSPASIFTRVVYMEFSKR